MISEIRWIFAISECGLWIAECCDTMGERMERIGRIRTDFFDLPILKYKQNKKKIRSNLPNPPHPFSHRITTTTFRNPKSTFRNRKGFFFPDRKKKKPLWSMIYKIRQRHYRSENVVSVATISLTGQFYFLSAKNSFTLSLCRICSLKE
jgi:hypothetical protein